MKNFKIIIIAIVFSIPALSNADIQDRINSCEASGNRSCIFSILRELAGPNKGSSASKCVCSTADGFHKCTLGLDAHVYFLTRDGNVVKSECASNKDKAYVNCIKESNKNKACK